MSAQLDDDDDKQVVGFVMQTLARIRERYPDMKNSEIAKRVGVKPETVSRWKHGHLKNIQLSNLQSLLMILEIKLGDCLHFPGEVGLDIAMSLLRRAAQLPPEKRTSSG